MHSLHSWFRNNATKHLLVPVMDIIHIWVKSGVTPWWLLMVSVTTMSSTWIMRLSIRYYGYDFIGIFRKLPLGDVKLHFHAPPLHDCKIGPADIPEAAYKNSNSLFDPDDITNISLDVSFWDDYRYHRYLMLQGVYSYIQFKLWWEAWKVKRAKPA